MRVSAAEGVRAIFWPSLVDTNRGQTEGSTLLLCTEAPLSPGGTPRRASRLFKPDRPCQPDVWDRFWGQVAVRRHTAPGQEKGHLAGPLQSPLTAERECIRYANKRQAA